MAAEYAARDGPIADDEFFHAEQNARLAQNAEQYYRTMFLGRVSSWNLRDRHMADTLEALARPPRHAAGAAGQGRRLGAQLPPRRRAGHRERRGGRAQRGATRPRAAPGRRRARRHDHLYRHGDGGLRLGGARRVQAGATGPGRQLRGALPRRRAGRSSCSGFARGATAAERPCGRANWSEAIGVIYQPADTSGQTHLFPRRSPASSTSSSTSTRRGRSSRSKHAAHWEAGELPETYPVGV